RTLLLQEMGMSQPQRYEVLVLGSGAGGKLLAWSGRRTVVVERKWIGDSCPNVNCLPSKNEIWSAKVADLVHHAAKFGNDLPNRSTHNGFLVNAALTAGDAVRAMKQTMAEDCYRTRVEESHGYDACRAGLSPQRAV